MRMLASLLPGLMANIAAPALAYSLVRPHVASSATALLAAVAIPAGWTLAALALELHEPAVTGALGLACMVSVIARRPLYLMALPVVTYDRPGLSRSPLDDPGKDPAITIATHSEDVHRILTALGAAPAMVFGGSIGALIGLDLLIRHPGGVRMLVARTARRLTAEPTRSEQKAWLAGEAGSYGGRMELHVCGVSLPGHVPVDLWTDRGRISRAPVAGARTIAMAGFVLPGLVDAHSHPGAPRTGQPLDEEVLRADLLAHRAAGVTAVRVVGAPARLPGWIAEDPELPLVISAGPWLSTPGLFIPGWGREVAAAELPDAAAEEAATGDGWVKLRGDWVVDEETVAEPRLLSAGVLAEAVRRVHEVGGRVAVHAMHEVACRRAVEAGVDSLEHGMWLAHDLLPQMAAQGTALVPTYTPWAGQMKEIRRLQSPAREWFLDGYTRLGPLTVAAHAAGVAVLAGTDFRPHGTVAAEVRHLAEGGLPSEAALGAACWTARGFLGLRGLDDGAPADFVIYDRDPLTDLQVLDHPAHVVLRGRLSDPAPRNGAR